MILRNLDGAAIQTLGYAFHVKAELNYNETSTLTFDYPAHVDGQQIPGYDKLVGMRIIDALGIGQFIITNPSIKEDAAKEIKSVTAYSLEYEFTYKKISLENGTYNFWNPLAKNNTILGIILERMPSWKVGKVDSSLIGKYRTFDVSDQNLYNFIKGTLQETYSCIFDFDTYERKINVRDVSSAVNIRPIYIALENLAKEIAIKENTENIFTCLDVNGADGVSIRNVNPMGTNKIYNLDYFMVPEYFPVSLISKWEAWKAGYEARQAEYFNRVVENSLLTMRIVNEKAALTELEGQLSVLEQQQAVAVEAAAKGLTQDLQSFASQIAAKKAEIAAKKASITAVEQQAANSLAAIKRINQETSWSAYGINQAEQELLDRYIKEDAISDSSFVVTEIDSYASKAESYPAAGITVQLTGAKLTGSPLGGKVVYSATGGTATVTVNGAVKLSGPNIRSAFDVNGSTGIASLYLESGCATLSGSISISTDAAVDPAVGGNVVEGSLATITSSRADVYITKNLTEYSQRSVEWDLFEYGKEVLDRVAWPSYNFSIDSANFLAIDEFDAFRRQLKLGDKLYLNLGRTFGILAPVLIGAHIDFEKSSLELEFSDSFSLSDSAFKLADLLDQSISMGKSVDFNKYNYNDWVDSGASNSVRDFMFSALDVAKNAVLSSSGQAVTWDGSGLRLRKWKDEAHTDYEDEQIWIINNNIVFTDDNWNTAKMAIGKFSDPNLGECWGIVAPNLVGTLLAGENLVIESSKKDGGVAVFRVDADGARLYNSHFDLANEYVSGGIRKVGRISLHPSIGIVSGSAANVDSLYAYDSRGNIIGVRATDGTVLTNIAGMGSKTPAASFWADMNGDVYMRGTVYATDGIFQGTVQASKFLDANGNDMMSGGKFKEEYLTLDGISLNFEKSIEDSYNQIKEEYTAAISVSATDLTTKFDEKITSVNGNITNLSSEVKQTAEKLESTVEKVTTMDGKLTTTTSIATQTAEKFSWIVKSGNNSSNFEITDRMIQLVSDKIVIDADKIIMTGSITWDDLADSVQNNIMGAQTDAEDAKSIAEAAKNLVSGTKDEAVAAAKDLVTQLANGKYVGGTFINEKTVMSPTLTGNIVVSGTFVGNQFIAQVDSGDRGGFVLSTGEEKYGDICRIFYNDMGGFGPETVIYGNGGTLFFDNWSHIYGVPATFA